MRYKLLGKSGLRVSELALGTMTFGEDWGWGASKEESRKQFDLFVRPAGTSSTPRSITPTAPARPSSIHQSQRDYFVIATKYTLSRNWEDPNGGGNSRKNMAVSLETSLKRLRTDYIDLYWLHMWDYLTPVEEVMRAWTTWCGRVRCCMWASRTHPPGS
jgi:aryl-alcohol dehydrogenase-like predicted oxidoreductase